MPNCNPTPPRRGFVCSVCGLPLLPYKVRKPQVGLVVRYRRCANYPVCIGRGITEERAAKDRLPRVAVA